MFKHHYKDIDREAYPNRRNCAGMSLVEVLVGTSVILIFMILLSSAYSFVVRESARSAEHTTASYLLVEGAEAIKSLRDESWNNRIVPIANDTVHYLHFDGQHWRATTTPQVIDGTFTRWFVLSRVWRDGNDDIAMFGTVDSGARKLNVSVRWADNTSTTTKRMEMYVMDIFNN